MIDSSVDDARVRRGIRLYREHGEEITLHGDLWIVRGDTRNYTVSLDRESCDCPDHKQREVICKHLYAVMIVNAKGR